MDETWRPVVGYEGLYEVSDQGRVRSLPRRVRLGKTTRLIPERILVPHNHYRGYHRVDLYKEGVSTHSFVHRIVAIAFLPNPFNKPIVNHRDGNKRNNAVSNFEWATDSENIVHYYATRPQAPVDNDF